jgi:hypothetical protein
MALILKRASASRPSGQWSDDAYDVLADEVVVGRIFKANAAPVGYGNDEKRRTSHHDTFDSLPCRILVIWNVSLPHYRRALGASKGERLWRMQV